MPLIVGNLDDDQAATLRAALNSLGLSASQLTGDAAERLRGGPLLPGEWVKLPAIYKLALAGAGTVTIDARAADGTITPATKTYEANGARDVYPYFGTAIAVRATVTGTASAEIL